MVCDTRNAACRAHRCRAAGPHARTTSIYCLAVSLQTGVVQEFKHASPGFAQSNVMLNCSTFVFTLHCDGQRIVSVGDASWKQEAVMVSECAT